MDRRKMMWVLGSGGAVIALSACDAMPEKAVAPWRGPDAGMTDSRLRALSWAMLAPNPHNLQSWIADIREAGQITLYVDRERLLPQTDPESRQILIGCGAFLELLRMAAQHEGWAVEINVLPQGEYPASGVDDRPFAQVRFVGQGQTKPDPLFAKVALRRTNRGTYENRMPSDTDMQQRHQLAQVTRWQGISLHAIDPAR